MASPGFDGAPLVIKARREARALCSATRGGRRMALPDGVCLPRCSVGGFATGCAAAWAIPTRRRVPAAGGSESVRWQVSRASWTILWPLISFVVMQAMAMIQII